MSNWNDGTYVIDANLLGVAMRDLPVKSCALCGALVPLTHLARHDKFHEGVAALARVWLKDNVGKIATALANAAKVVLGEREPDETVAPEMISAYGLAFGDRTEPAPSPVRSEEEAAKCSCLCHSGGAAHVHQCVCEAAGVDIRRHSVTGEVIMVDRIDIAPPDHHHDAP